MRNNRLIDFKSTEVVDMGNRENVAKLLGKYLNETCDEQELNILLEFIRNKQIDSDLKHVLETYWEKNDSFRHQLDKEELGGVLNAIHHQINIENSERQDLGIVKRLSSYAVRAAAILFIPLLIGSLWMFMREDVAYINESMVTLETPMGAKLRTTLPDGTEVWQNSGTTIKYPTHFTSKNRSVEITGEAYFHVESDKANPFFVHTAKGTIKVTGTRFNVDAYDANTTSVVLEEGKLAYHPINSKKEFQMKSSEQIINKNSKVYQQTVDVDKYISWIKGRLVFRDDPLETIITKLERWYATDIDIIDDSGNLQKLTLTLTVENKSLPQVLDFIANAAQLEVRSVEIKTGDENALMNMKYLISNN